MRNPLACFNRLDVIQKRINTENGKDDHCRAKANYYFLADKKFHLINRTSKPTIMVRKYTNLPGKVGNISTIKLRDELISVNGDFPVFAEIFFGCARFTITIPKPSIK